MRLPGLPRLPVSRRRHERVCAEAKHAHREAERLGKAMSAARRERDLASQAADVLQSRVARLERAVRGHVTATSSHDHEHLRAVLDGHDRQERDDEPESDHDWTGRRRLGPDWEHLQGGWPR